MRKFVLFVAAAALLGSGPVIAQQQVRTIDPNQAIDGDLSRPQQQAPQSYPDPQAQPPAYQDPPQHYQDQSSQQQSYQNQAYQDQGRPPAEPDTGVSPAPYGTPPADGARAEADAAAGRGDTFSQSELLSAAEGTFGKGAAGLAGILERTLKEQGRPNAYIAGTEGAGAIAVGLRYGKGQLFHKIEGQQPVYWQGPSLGFDVGGDGSKVFVLVYNLYDTADLYKRFPAAEGRLYFVGGFAATYLRRGNIVLIPIRLGVGWRQGVNIGYMKFTHKSRWFPF